MAIKAITMDFYGTLVRDNNPVIRDICKRISQSAVKMIVSPADVGMAWWRIVDEMMHSGTFYDSKTLEQTALKKIVEDYRSVENPDALFEEVMESLKKPMIYPDAETFLDRIPVSFAIIENMDKDILEDAMCYTQIEAENVISSEDAKVYKPSPEIFEAAAEKLKLKPSEILHAGSSIQYDIAPAKKAGMKTCWINRQKKPKKSNIKPNIECASLFDLRMMIK